jgi:hypothetical protein
MNDVGMLNQVVVDIHSQLDRLRLTCLQQPAERGPTSAAVCRHCTVAHAVVLPLAFPAAVIGGFAARAPQELSRTTLDIIATVSSTREVGCATLCHVRVYRLGRARRAIPQAQAK